MVEIHATIRLRPIRIGFLVRPTKLADVKRIMSVNACLWGGIFNPIIPVYRSAPPEWRDPTGSTMSGQSVARGYVRFFEPDVYVEVEEGLLEKAGLGAIRGKQVGFQGAVLTLDQLFGLRGDRRAPGIGPRSR